MRRVQTTYESEPVGWRFGRFVVLLGVVFAVTGAVVVTQRFQPETLALITGVIIAGIPLLAIVALFGFITLKIASRPRNEPQQMTIPPIIMQLPQTPQNALTDNGYPWDIPQRQPATRSWDVIGDED